MFENLIPKNFSLQKQMLILQLKTNRNFAYINTTVQRPQ